MWTGVGHFVDQVDVTVEQDDGQSVGDVRRRSNVVSHCSDPWITLKQESRQIIFLLLNKTQTQTCFLGVNPSGSMSDVR